MTCGGKTAAALRTAAPDREATNHRATRREIGGPAPVADGDFAEQGRRQFGIGADYPVAIIILRHDGPRFVFFFFVARATTPIP